MEIEAISKDLIKPKPVNLSPGDIIKLENNWKYLVFSSRGKVLDNIVTNLGGIELGFLIIGNEAGSAEYELTKGVHHYIKDGQYTLVGRAHKLTIEKV